MSDNDFAEQDLLRLIEQGVAASADKLAKISRTEWSTQTVSIKTVPLEKFSAVPAADEQDYYGAYFTMPGGVFLVMFPARSATAFADVFLPKSALHPDGIKDREKESLAEISNIVVNAVSTVIADTCDTAFFLSAPKMSLGKKRDLLKAAPDMVMPRGDKFTIMAYVHMSSAALSSDCNVAILLSAAWKDKLFSAL